MSCPSCHHTTPLQWHLGTLGVSCWYLALDAMTCLALHATTQHSYSGTLALWDLHACSWHGCLWHGCLGLSCPLCHHTSLQWHLGTPGFSCLYLALDALTCLALHATTLPCDTHSTHTAGLIGDSDAQGGWAKGLAAAQALGSWMLAECGRLGFRSAAAPHTTRHTT